MKQTLIIDGNAVYEIDETCMLKNKIDTEKERKEKEKEEHNRQKQQKCYM